MVLQKEYGNAKIRKNMGNGISIITVTYNNKEALIRTIESVSQQDYELKEFIIIDGNSCDGTKEVFEQYRSVINISISEPDNGIYDAMNKGIKQAHNEWVIMLNAGDVFTDRHVLSNILKKTISPTVSFLYSDYYEVNKQKKKILKHVDRAKGVVFHQASIYRKSLHETYGYYLQTHPYIVSDLLFFLSVPDKEYLKIPTIISINDTSGISRNGTWVAEQALGMRIGFGIENIIMGALKFIKIKILKMIELS